MAVQDSDLLLVQRGTTPFRETAANVQSYVNAEITAGNVLPPIASAAQLGVIRVGANLTIDAGTGILDAVLPSGVEFQGEWTDALNPPVSPQNGQFWVWTGGAAATLTNAQWLSINGSVVNVGDRLWFDSSPDWSIVVGGGGGITAVTGTAPIQVGGTAQEPDISIDAATTTEAGSMSAADKAKLDAIDAGAEVNVDPTQTYTAAAQGTLTLTPGGDDTIIPVATTTLAGLMSAADKNAFDSLVASPGGVVSITAGDGIVVGGTAGIPIVSANFGAATPNGTPTTVMPFDISMLGDLP